MEFIILGIIWIVIMAGLLIGGLVYVLRFFCVKVPRARRWVSEHNGALIGSEEFFKWCSDHGIDPGYYL